MEVNKVYTCIKNNLLNLLVQKLLKIFFNGTRNTKTKSQDFLLGNILYNGQLNIGIIFCLSVKFYITMERVQKVSFTQKVKYLKILFLKNSILSFQITKFLTETLFMFYGLENLNDKFSYFKKQLSKINYMILQYIIKTMYKGFKFQKISFSCLYI